VIRTILGLIRLIHPAPAAAVISLSAALAAIIASQAGTPPLGMRAILAVVAVAGSQILTGALNDWVDRDRDRLAQPSKPIPAEDVSPGAALGLAAAGAIIQLAASALLGWLPLLLGAAASTSAAAYNLWLSRTPFSVLPYLVSFGILPLWIAAGVGVDISRVAAASVLVAPFAAAAHLANTLRDFHTDARLGSRNLAQVLGRQRAIALAWALAVGVGVAVGAAVVIGGRGTAPVLGLGTLGLIAVGQGLAGPTRLWYGILLAAVAWTAAWALASG
jgi:4-hydroxybenzoate polyprenyltransferase